MIRLTFRWWNFILLVCAGLLGLAPATGLGQDATPVAGPLPDGVSVVASGLTNPRGFAWDADGALVLALAGVGGPNQVIAEDGTEFPFFNGMSSSIARMENGCAVPVAEGIASFLWSDPGWIWGAMDVAFLNGQLYALLGGGGADVALPDHPNGVYRVNDDGSLEIVSDLSAFFREHPPAFTPWDFGADGSLFDLEAGTDRLWVSEAVGGRLLTVMPDGETVLIADLSEDHMVPTGVAVDPAGGAFLNHETVAPFPDGAAKVIHVAEDGTQTDRWTGLTAGTDLVMGPDDTLYAAEMATGNSDEPPYLAPHTGQVVRQTGPDSMDPVVTGIEYPVFLGFGPDEALYLTYPAFGPDAGEGLGAILRIDPAAMPVDLANIGVLEPSCAGDAAVEAPASGESVTIADFAYDASALAAPVGERVTWTNDDWAPHTVTATDGAFDSGRLDTGDFFSWTFETPGEYGYYCAFHPGMTGTIAVS